MRMTLSVLGGVEPQAEGVDKKMASIEIDPGMRPKWAGRAHRHARAVSEVRPRETKSPAKATRLSCHTRRLKIYVRRPE